jgi:hypothetical protein
MVYVLLTSLTLIAVFIAVRFKKLINERNEIQLLEEIEKDFIEDFSLESADITNIKSDDLKELIEWMEDVQLEDKIKNSSSS